MKYSRFVHKEDTEIPKPPIKFENDRSNKGRSIIYSIGKMITLIWLRQMTNYHSCTLIVMLYSHLDKSEEQRSTAPEEALKITFHPVFSEPPLPDGVAYEL